MPQENNFPDNNWSEVQSGGVLDFQNLLENVLFSNSDNNDQENAQVIWEN